MDFEPVAEVLGDDSEPFDVVAARERIATAADLMAQLDPFEQRVVAVMATHNLGVKRAAKAMGEPVDTVLAASRSAQRKLDQVAAITAAGRMCDYREQAIHAHAHGEAQRPSKRRSPGRTSPHVLGADPPTPSSLREMSGREYQRAASAAFLPPPMLAVELHGRWIERLISLLSTGRAPSGTATAERTAGVLGGGGLVKAAAATSAIVIAGAGVGARVVHSLEAPAPVHHHHKASRAPGVERDRGSEHRADHRYQRGLDATPTTPQRRDPARQTPSDIAAEPRPRISRARRGRGRRHRHHKSLWQ